MKMFLVPSVIFEWLPAQEIWLSEPSDIADGTVWDMVPKEVAIKYGSVRPTVDNRRHREDDALAIADDGVPLCVFENRNVLPKLQILFIVLHQRIGTPLPVLQRRYATNASN
jgi:hypothetical protein